MDGVQQDGAADGDPAAAGALLGTLRAVGLMGPWLAVQLGEEEPLARQLAERAGLALEPWMVALVKSQIDAALKSLEMEVRLAGGAKTPGQQAIDDAVHHAVKERSAVSSAASGPPPKGSIVVPKRGKLGKIPRGPTTNSSGGNMEEEKVIHLLYQELDLVGAPVVGQIEATANPARAKMALLGKFRASTVKRYLAYWQGFRKWTMDTTGSLPFRGEQLVDYLLAREEEGMGATVPLSVGKGVAWFEKLARYDGDQMMSSAPLVETVVRDLLRKLEDKAPPRRRAPRMLSAFVPALEQIVMDRLREDNVRAGAWVRLLKIWSSLRFDDVAHLRKDMVCVYDRKLSGLMKRTKTTGGGKRVKELPFHVSTEAWVQYEGWLTEGLQALGRALGGNYELMVPAGTSKGDVTGGEVMAYQEAVAWSTEVMQDLRDEKGEQLIPHGWERYWTEHSERATMPSALAALGIEKSERDLLGRWTPEGSDQYVRTYNAVVGRLQAVYAAPLREGRGYEAFDEGAVLEGLKTWLCEKWNADPTEAGTAVDAWKKKLSPWMGFADQVRKGAVAAGLDAPGEPVAKAMSSSSSSSDSSSEDTEATSSKRRKVDRLEEERPPGFIVVYNRINRGKLHRAGKGGCWMARHRRFKKATTYDGEPDEGAYTSRCRLCWQDIGKESSSSDSEDEVVESVPEAMPMCSQGG